MQNFIEVGGVQFEVRADGTLALAEIDKIENRLGKTEKEMGLFSNKMKTVFLAIGGAIAGAFGVFLAWMKKAVPMASDFTERQSKMVTVFSDVKKEALAAARALTAYGFSLSDATAAIADTGDVLTGLGLGQKEALKLSDTVARLAQDLVSFTNYSGGVKGAIDVLTKGLLGERDGLVGLGIKLNETELKRMGYVDSMSLQEKAEITLQAIMAQSKNAMGDYGRTQDGFANQQRKLAANFQNLSVTVAQKLLPSLTGVLQWFNKQFEKSQDLEQTTARLTDLLRLRKEVTDKLSGSVKDLTEQERRNLEVQELQIKKELNDTIKRLVKNYNEYFQVKRSTESIQGGSIFGEGNSKLEALSNLIEKIKKQIDETNEKIKSGFYDESYIRELATTQGKLNDELIRVSGQYTQAKEQQIFAVEELAKALHENLLTEQELAYLPKALKDQIIALSRDPGFLTSLDKASEETGKKGGTKAGTAWAMSFLDKINLKESIGAEEKDLISELQTYIDKYREQYELSKKEFLSTGQIWEKRSDFLKNYTAVQEKLVALLEKEKKIRSEGSRETGSSPVRMGSSPMEGESTRSRGNLNIDMDKVLSQLDTAISLAKTFAKTLGIEASESAGKLASLLSEIGSNIPGLPGAILQAAGVVFELTSGIINAIEGEVDMTTEWKQQQKELDALNDQLDAANTRLNVMKGILNTIELAKKLGLDDLSQVRPELEKINKQLMDENKLIAEKFHLSINKDGIITDLDAIDEKVTSLTGSQTKVNSLLRQLRGVQGRIKNNIFQGDFLSEDDQKLIKSITNQLVAAGAITRDLADKIVAESAGSVLGVSSDIAEYISKAVTDTEGKLGELKTQIELLASVAGNDQELLQNLEQLRLLAVSDMQEEIGLLEKQYNLLNATGQSTEENIQNQLDLVGGMLEQYQALNDAGQYQAEIYDLLTQQAQLRKKLEEGTATAMQKELDILNKIKGTGLFDEQNLYQVGLLNQFADRVGMSAAQKLDLFQNYNIDNVAGSRTMQVDNINLSLYEASQNTLVKGVEQLFSGLWGGLS